MRNRTYTGSMHKDLEMLDSLFLNATEGILVVNDKGKIIMINPCAQRMFGYAEEEIIGQTIEKLIPSRFHSKHIGNREKYTKDPHARPMGKGLDLFAQTKDGREFPVEISLSHFSTSDGQFVMSFIIDITERKRQEAELKSASERLMQTSEALAKLNTDLENKVQERTKELEIANKDLNDSKKEVLKALEVEKELNNLKSRFVTTASHEFRTPLGTILSSASLIARYEGSEETEKRMKHVERIRSAVGNLTEILNDFLSVEKLEEGIVRNNPVQFDLEDFIHSIIEELKTITKKGQQIAFRHKGNTTSVFLDNQLLRNSLINLISNAIKYSEEGKEITVQSTMNGNSIRIEITDQGIGIPPEDQQHMFGRFFRAKNANNIQGTGLGLNIVRKYIELMEGKIGFSSELGVGTTFFVELPYLKP
ncbi:MAG TPA: ATP-binding protein [Flavobacteriales bacterium]|nr:ATP-binding protein [Flavobacteriales bacterium]